uniref:Uncharacterized protein n=1 Tax=Megaselia scalaris TaxID=36166 RepID=T1GJ11_MEGSC
AERLATGRNENEQSSELHSSSESAYDLHFSSEPDCDMPLSQQHKQREKSQKRANIHEQSSELHSSFESGSHVGPKIKRNMTKPKTWPTQVSPRYPNIHEQSSELHSSSESGSLAHVGPKIKSISEYILGTVTL